MRSHPVAVVLVAVMILTMLGAAGTAGGTAQSRSAVAGSISVMAAWSGAEQEAFEAVLARFEARNPNVEISYTSGGDQLATVLSTAVRGGNPPDIAALPQPGLMREFVGQEALKPLSFARPTIQRNFAPVWLSLGTTGGTLYGLIFKAANKSTVWYSVPAFREAGVKPPTTWPGLLKAAQTLRASGTPAYSIAGADGWTLTDLFENIYLRQAGPTRYDRLSTHKLKWTDPSVKRALRTMAQIFVDAANVAGGRAGALQTDFPTSVTNVFRSRPKAAMVFEGDFVQGIITGSTKAKPRTGFNQFAFPAIGNSGYPVVGGGDMVVMFKDSPASRALVTYLATPEAATIRARRGGFSSPNRNVKPSAYPDSIGRAAAIALARAKVFRFDLSDLQPAAFGGTVGQGQFKLFQDFLKNPRNVNTIAAELEKAAAKAYGR